MAVNSGPAGHVCHPFFLRAPVIRLSLQVGAQEASCSPVGHARGPAWQTLTWDTAGRWASPGLEMHPNMHCKAQPRSLLGSNLFTWKDLSRTQS